MANNTPRSPITTHILDTARGHPATGVHTVLEIALEGAEGSWSPLGHGVSDDDGRIGNLLPSEHRLEPGTYRLRFEVADYLSRHGNSGFYPCIPVIFRVVETDQHYHVPLLLNPFGYSTYRGS